MAGTWHAEFKQMKDTKKRLRQERTAPSKVKRTVTVMVEWTTPRFGLTTWPAIQMLPLQRFSSQPRLTNAFGSF